MTVNKRKKNSRQRGSWTHGWGEKKKHRGAGNRGGRGMAGTGKRGDARKPSIWHDPDYFGKHGFIFKGKRLTPVCSVNIKDIEAHFSLYLAKKLITEKDGFFVVQLEKIGFTKLLGKGTPTRKYHIEAAFASDRAKKAIEKKEGRVVLTEKRVIQQAPAKEKVAPKEKILKAQQAAA